jgi:hypothetical protein
MSPDAFSFTIRPVRRQPAENSEETKSFLLRAHLPPRLNNTKKSHCSRDFL